MDEFQEISALKADWEKGTFGFPERITVADIPYRYYKSSSFPLFDAITKDKHPFVIYHTATNNKNQARINGMDQLIVFLWGSDGHSRLVPYDVRTVSGPRAGAMFEQVETIGDVALLKIALPSGVVAMKGKVDTGAEISSMHCDGKPRIVGQTVQFVNRHASPNVIQAPLVDQQAVSSADGGTEYRPVIELDVEINGKTVRKAMFNLNDRSKMEYPVLIGQNVLEKTGFLINPRQNNVHESDDWLTDEELLTVTDDDILSLIENVLPTMNTSISTYDSEQISKICQLLDESSVSIGDLFKYIRTETLKRLDKIEY